LRCDHVSILEPIALQKVAHESTPESGTSGKLLIVIVLAVGLAAAAASWWFRYAATHRAAQYWGPEAARLIRDAPHVTLRTFDPAVDGERGNPDALPRNISDARGLTHLRAALLEDRSYDWSALGPPASDWTSALVFEEGDGAEPRLVILFSPDFGCAANGSADAPTRRTISCRPIAAGLQQFFTEQTDD
jgi:hypothetical protein